jgi:hypothetical protein
MGVGFNGWAPAQNLPATRFVPARNFAAVHGIPALKDLSPRLGTSYDLFGNGRTAVKVALGRFVESSKVTLTRSFSQAARPNSGNRFRFGRSRLLLCLLDR